MKRRIQKANGAYLLNSVSQFIAPGVERPVNGGGGTQHLPVTPFGRTRRRLPLRACSLATIYPSRLYRVNLELKFRPLSIQIQSEILLRAGSVIGIGATCAQYVGVYAANCR